MLFKIIAFVAAAVPVFLFVRAVLFGGRKTRLSAHLAEFRRSIDRAVWFFLAAIAVVVTIALGHLAWTWWSP
jgi:hypothetical protein